MRFVKVNGNNLKAHKCFLCQKRTDGDVVKTNRQYKVGTVSRPASFCSLCIQTLAVSIDYPTKNQLENLRNKVDNYKALVKENEKLNKENDILKEEAIENLSENYLSVLNNKLTTEEV